MGGGKEGGGQAEQGGLLRDCPNVSHCAFHLLLVSRFSLNLCDFSVYCMQKLSMYLEYIS